MTDLILNLLKLQALDFDETTDVQPSQRDQLRTLIPQPILGHYDRLVARGKKGLAAVRNQVCAGCHMRLPIGTINTLMQGLDIQLCDSCGRYLYVPDAGETQFVEKIEAAKPTAKPRKRKGLAHAAA